MKIKKQLEVLKSEQAIVRSCHNPNICLYLGATRDKRGNLVLVSELMETDLDNYISKKRNQPSLYTCMQIAFKIATGMSWIDGKVIHTDLVRIFCHGSFFFFLTKLAEVSTHCLLIISDTNNGAFPPQGEI